MEDRLRSLWPKFRFNLRSSAALACLFWAFFTVGLGVAWATENPGAVPQEANVTTQLGAEVDMDLVFTDSNGETRKLRDFVTPNRPFIITPVYFKCPRLCGLVFDAFVGLVNAVDLNIGEHFDVLSVSFNSAEGAADGKRRSDKYLNLYRDPAKAQAGWRFLTGTEQNVSALMQQIGFHYKQDGGEFSHSVAIMVMTPGGKISQYFTDINFPDRDVRLSLIEASEGKIGTALDHFLLFCFRFDPTKGKYTWAAWNFLRLGVGLCFILSVTFVIKSIRKGRPQQI